MTPRYLAALLLAATALHAGNAPLADAPTAFLRQQAASPVHWSPWSEAVLASAKQQSRPVYVFVGSPLSELTRATINQTFSSEKTVAWINENFFCVFVDADAQPEVAAYAQHFIASVKQLRGSPVHLWLTPELQPYDGANYLPPSEEWGKPGFLKAARGALEAWTVEPARARALAEEALGMMKLPPLDPSAKFEVAAKLEAATKAWVAASDPQNGGFGPAPKLARPELIRFLLGRDAAAQAAALNAARALVNGALRDPVDGGFYRRCIDEAWKEPYYQKTLVDQARTALALLEAADFAKDDKLRAAGLGALDFVLKELKNPDGTFAAALDGTLEENQDPAKRPKFEKAGKASPAALGLLTTALLRTGEKRFAAVAAQLADRLRAGLIHATAADLTAGTLAFRALGDEVAAGALAARAHELYFDSSTGAYMASPAELPLGIAVRVPASGDMPSAEVLALLAGVDQKTAGLIRHNLLNQIEYDELPPGDVLLGLAR